MIKRQSDREGYWNGNLFLSYSIYKIRKNERRREGVKRESERWRDR